MLAKKRRQEVPYVWDPEIQWLNYTKKLRLTDKRRLRTRLRKIINILDEQEQLALMK
jgi:hypothetical protein